MLYGWKENSMLTNCLAACIHLSSTVSQLFKPQVQKKSPFSRTAAHIFVSSGDAPATITQYVAWMERQFNACQTPCCMYLSIFNSFRVIRCLSQCVSPKSLFLPHFCFPWGRPWGNHTKCCMDGGWKENSMLTNCRCMCPSNYNRFWDRGRYLWRNRHFIIPPCIRRPR